MGPFQQAEGTVVAAVAPWVPVRREPADAAEQVTQLLIGERAEVVSVGDRDWIRVRCAHDGYEGWCDAKMVADRPTVGDYLLRPALSVWRWPDGSTRWLPAGGYLTAKDGGGWEAPDGADVEPVDAGGAADWRAWVGVPYLWGGRTAAGVDCSGFMQILARLQHPDRFMDRDAADQFALGSPVAFTEHEAGDWAFFANPAGRIVHVGLVTARHQIVHAAGQVRVDRLSERGIERELPNGSWHLTHAFAGMRRHA